jgi:hypothetical protein
LEEVFKHVSFQELAEFLPGLRGCPEIMSVCIILLARSYDGNLNKEI